MWPVAESQRQRPGTSAAGLHDLDGVRNLIQAVGRNFESGQLRQHRLDHRVRVRKTAPSGPLPASVSGTRGPWRFQLRARAQRPERQVARRTGGRARGNLRDGSGLVVRCGIRIHRGMHAGQLPIHQVPSASGWQRPGPGSARGLGRTRRRWLCAQWPGPHGRHR